MSIMPLYCSLVMLKILSSAADGDRASKPDDKKSGLKVIEFVLSLRKRSKGVVDLVDSIGLDCGEPNDAGVGGTTCGSWGCFERKLSLIRGLPTSRDA